MRIGVDLMGSDSAPQTLFSAVLEAVHQLDATHIFVVFVTKSIAEELSPKARSSGRIQFRTVADAIQMSDEPLFAVRRKKGSSLLTGIRLLRKREIDAFVTAGNTGALIASATLSLPLFPDIKRPALLAALPTELGSIAVVDVGGNVSCKAQHLVQFAKLGAAFQHCHLNASMPRVGLLNIGVESKKGTSELRLAYKMLKENADQTPPMQFIGNVEGRDVFQGHIDVLVTDGFTGNVLLKTSEGLAHFIFDFLKKSLMKEEIATHFYETLKNLQLQFKYDEYPGAFLCGVERVVIKCHGSVTPQALLRGIIGAANMVRNDSVGKIKAMISG
jgi:glycerol-3-phosphate acyltransferase PlsX